MTDDRALEAPFCLFLADTTDPKSIKTASGLVEWAPERVACEYALPGCTVTTGVPRAYSLREAREKYGAKTLVVGTVMSTPIALPESWLTSFSDAMVAGLDVACGMHDRANDYRQLYLMAKTTGRRLVDFRYSPREYVLGTGKPRRGIRILVVGQDCNIGKKYTSISLTRYLKSIGVNATYRPTGQTGSLIAAGERSIVLDTVPGDFLAGAVEWLAPENDADHVDVIEGQAGLFNPSMGQLVLGLIYGSQPDLIVFCVDPLREKMRGLDYAPVDFEFEMQYVKTFALRVNPHAKFAGLSVNYGDLNEDLRSAVLRNYSSRVGGYSYPRLPGATSRFSPTVLDPNDHGSFAYLGEYVKELCAANVRGQYRDLQDVHHQHALSF